MAKVLLISNLILSIFYSSVDWAGQFEQQGSDRTNDRVQRSLAAMFPLNQDQSLGFECFFALICLRSPRHQLCKNSPCPLLNNSPRILIHPNDGWWHLFMEASGIQFKQSWLLKLALPLIFHVASCDRLSVFSSLKWGL